MNEFRDAFSIAMTVDSVADAEITNVLAIGDPEVCAEFGSTLQYDRVSFSDLHSVDEALLETLAPQLIVSPLVATDFDCLDVAYVLGRHGFRGSYRAVTESIPHPAIVRREVRSISPLLDFDVIQTHGVAVRLS